MTAAIDDLLVRAKGHRDAGRLAAAEEAAREAVAANGEHAEAQRLLGTVLWREGRYRDAVAALERSLAIEPSNEKALAQLGQVLAEEGRLSESAEAARRWIALSPDSVGAWSSLARLKRFDPGDPDLAKLEELAAARELTVDEDILLSFALAKAYDDVGDYDRAFAWLERANRTKRSTLEYNVEQPIAFFQRIEKTFDAGLVERFSSAGSDSDVPIFIVGMPRSGTSLVEQILATHPSVHGAGELLDIQELSLSISLLNHEAEPYPEGVRRLREDDLTALGAGYVARLRAQAPQASRIVDKHPLNFRYVGLIRLALPRARILHCVRDAADTCMSIYATNFSDFPASYDLVELGRLYCAYARLMDHWRRTFPGALIEVRYEELVGDLTGGARALVGACGLPWDERCLDFHRTERPVRTASFAQVRKPVYQSSVGRWRRYERRLAPLMAELTRCSEAPRDGD